MIACMTLCALTCTHNMRACVLLMNRSPQGYETTANTLAYAVYNISAHPEVEARLLAEIDAVGHDRVIGYADMSQACH
jgi:cytochrome P450